MSHTPGPWTQDAADDYVGAGGSIVAMTPLNDYTGTVGVSCIFTKPEDKQLAFSAPDLLAVLERVSWYLELRINGGPVRDTLCPHDNGIDECAQCLKDRVDAAIAKARGKA